MKVVVTNEFGANIRDYWSVSGNIIETALPGDILDYTPTDADILGWCEVTLPGNIEGYIQKQDINVIEGFIDFTKDELKYLIYLLNRVEEESIIESIIFLNSLNIKAEEVRSFISDLKRKIKEEEYNE